MLKYRSNVRGGRGRLVAAGLSLAVAGGAVAVALPGSVSAVLPPGAPAGAVAPNSDGGYTPSAWFGAGGPWDPTLGRETGTGGENELHDCQIFVNSPGADVVASTPPAFGADVYNRCTGLGIKNDDPGYSPLRTASGNARWQGQYGVITVDASGTPRVALGYCSQDNLSHPGAQYADGANKLIGDAAISAAGFSTDPTLKYVMWKYGNTYNSLDAAAVWNLNHMHQGSGAGLGITLGNFPNLSNDAAVNARIDSMNAEAFAKQGPWTLTTAIAPTGDSVTVRISGPGGGIPNEAVQIAVTGATGAPASVVTDASGNATFPITATAGPVNIEVNATSEAPGDYYIIRATTVDQQTIASPGPGVPLAASDSLQIADTPSIGTTATDAVDGDHIIGVGGSIIDTVAYSGVTVGQEYTLVAKLMTQAGVDTGVTASTTFTPTTVSGSVDVGPISIPASLNGTLVVFERLYLDTDTTAVPVAVHEDLTDVGQTFDTAAPTVGTTATDVADGDHIIGVGGSITDTVAYTGLIPGQQYTLVAKLMTQAGVDTGVTASVAFTPTAAAGTVDVGPIVVPASMAGTFVVFEDLYFGTDTTVTPIGTHHDLTDTNQTVRTGILIGTVATDNLDGDHVVGAAGSVIDTVAYSGLTPGQQYTLVAKIMTQAGVDTGITASASFTPTDPVGSVAVGPISIPANLAGTFVVFEDLYLGTDTTVPATAVHHDLTDTNQTFTTGVPTITTKVDKVDRKPGETNFDVGTVTGVDPSFVGKIVLKVYRDLPGDAITGAAVCASAPIHTITYDIAGNGDHASPVYTVAADEVPGVVYVHQESLVAPDGTVLATDACGAPTELTTITKKSSGGDFGGTY